jgi:predicted deacylase
MRIGNLEPVRGERVFATVTAAHTLSRIPVEVPVNLLAGRRDGPTLAVTAAIHGAECVGTFGLLRVMELVDLTQLRGMLVAMPVANPAAFEFGTRHTYWDGRILNRVGKGNPGGGYTERLAHVLYGQILPHVDAWIDIHSGTPERHMYYTIAKAQDQGDAVAKRSLEMAIAFGVPDIAVDTPWKDAKIDFPFPWITPEIGGGADFLRNGEAQIETCARGILNVMRLLGMLDGAVDVPYRFANLWKLHTDISNGPHGGVLFPRFRRGDTMREGDVYAVVKHPFSGEVLDELRSPGHGTLSPSGVVWPVVRPGEWLTVLGDVVDQVAVRG